MLNDINRAVGHLDKSMWIDAMKNLFTNYVRTELGKVVKRDQEC